MYVLTAIAALDSLMPRAAQILEGTCTNANNQYRVVIMNPKIITNLKNIKVIDTIRHRKATSEHTCKVLQIKSNYP